MSGRQTTGILLITSPTPEHSQKLQEWLNLEGGSFWGSGVAIRDPGKVDGPKRYPDIPYIRLTETTLGRNLYFNSHGWLLGVIDEMHWIIEDSEVVDRPHLYDKWCYNELLAAPGVVYRCYFYSLEKEYTRMMPSETNAVIWKTAEPSGIVTITNQGKTIKRHLIDAPPDGTNVTGLVKLKWDIVRKLNALREAVGLKPL